MNNFKYIVVQEDKVCALTKLYDDDNRPDPVALFLSTDKTLAEHICALLNTEEPIHG
jgi:hypothetical protein